MVRNKICPNCENDDTYYTGSEIFYCKGCNEEFQANSKLNIGKKEKKDKNMVFVKDIAVSGEYVDTLKDKRFVVIKAPYYEKYIDPETNKETESVVMLIELNDESKSQLEYKPNKTSLKAMANAHGYQMDNWLGKAFEFYTNKQNAFGKAMIVLYVADKKQ